MNRIRSYVFYVVAGASVAIAATLILLTFWAPPRVP
jgi:hypothetical protein